MGRLDLTDDIIDLVLYGRRMAWDERGCAAYAGVRTRQLNQWLNIGADLRRVIEDGRVKTLPRPGSQDRKCLDLYDAWCRDGSFAERKLQALLQRSAEGHWTPDHRWEDVIDDEGNPVMGRDGRPLRVRVQVEPKWVASDPRIALEMLERLFPGRWRKAPSSMINIQQNTITGGVGGMTSFIDLTDATPEQLAALTGQTDPAELLVIEADEADDG